MGELNPEKIVEFHENCDKCQFRDLSERDDPCFECLDNPVNVYSHRPVKFKARNSQKN